MPRTGPIIRNCKTCGNPFGTWQYKIDAGEGNYCSRKCRWACKSLEDLFWPNVEKLDTGCWEWKGARCVGEFDYGKISSGPRGASKTLLAHRVSWEIHFGPTELYVCHECDNPPCVRPDHLFEGTQKQNLEDMVSKGRSLTGDKNPARINAHLRPRGEDSHNAKLNESDVLEMRRMYESKEASGWAIAKIFNRPYPTIKCVLTYKTWRHVKALPLARTD